MGGLGEIPNKQVAGFMARYRFFFTPTRYASLSLALVEAMMAGVPIVGVAATELPVLITNGVNGYVDTHRGHILQCMRQLLDDRELAARWGRQAQRTARLRFGIGRFVDDWLETLSSLVGVKNE
jgi:glycosyltransferase involved in cell wall biosynthesis